MAIQVGQNVSAYGGTGGVAQPYWRESGNGGGWWDYQQTPWDYSNVDFGTPPIPGASPIVDSSGNFAGWGTPDGLQWTTRDKFNSYLAPEGSYGDWVGARPQSLPGNNSVSPWLKYGVLGALAAMGGYGALGAAGAFGAGAAGGAGGAGGAGFGTGAGGLWGAVDAGAFPAGAAYGAGGAGAGAGSSLWGTGANGAWGLNPGMTGGTGMAPSAASWWQNPSVWKSAAGVLGGGGSGGSSSGQQQSPWGSAVGGLLGAGLGYLDSANQPNEYTVRTEIDPALKAAYYGQGGLYQTAAGIYNQQQGQPNYLAQAGQQISGMANTLPGYNEAVANNKALWDSNPWVQQQQQDITNLATKNLNENILPGIGSEANSVGGYGGSRQGIAQAKSIGDMYTNLAPSLTGLASSAYENSQNRAMQGAQNQLNYGLQNQYQQAGLLGTGATMQQNAPWYNFNQLANFAKQLPGGQSTTNPIFNNTTTAALGGASMGSQVGGSLPWGSIFGGISDWFK